MVHVLLLLILYTEIADNQGERDRPCCVHPESRGVFTFVITVGGKTFLQELVGQDAGLGETPDGLAHLKVDVSSNNFIMEVVLFNDPRGGNIDGHFYVLNRLRVAVR